MLTGFSPLLGIVFSFASIFPYLGDTLAFTLLLFDALSSGFVWTQFVSALILIGIGHNISSHLLTPILIGSYTGVLPVQILLGLMIHVHLLGGFGLIFNIPLCILERSILAFWRSDLIGDKNKKSS
jgi:predicted PurR-regulated permease PerM